MDINFITSNLAKVKLANNRLAKYGISIDQKNIEIEENRSINVEEVALDKAKKALKLCKKPFLIEDSAFYIESLNGFPGTFMKLAFDILGDNKITKLIKDEKNKNAYIKSVLVYANPEKKILKVFTGVYSGKISNTPLGLNLRGWKVLRIFIPKGYKKTLAQMNNIEWNKFLKEFIINDHFEKFGKWISESKV